MTTNQKKSDMASAAKGHATAPVVNPGRHEFKCTICSHSNREEMQPTRSLRVCGCGGGCCFSGAKRTL